MKKIFSSHVTATALFILDTLILSGLGGGGSEETKENEGSEEDKEGETR